MENFLSNEGTVLIGELSIPRSLIGRQKAARARDALTFRRVSWGSSRRVRREADWVRKMNLATHQPAPQISLRGKERDWGGGPESLKKTPSPSTTGVLQELGQEKGAVHQERKKKSPAAVERKKDFGNEKIAR